MNQAKIEHKAILETLEEKRGYYKKEEKELSTLEQELSKISQVRGKVHKLFFDDPLGSI